VNLVIRDRTSVTGRYGRSVIRDKASTNLIGTEN